ncbi:MAG: hypothetical protein LWX07_01645 [Bacteroidetes bacterium]|nr:hypothetical protein [Bacteroidota bacterium]
MKQTAIIILPALFLALLFSSCAKKTGTSSDNRTKAARDTVCAVIKYDLSGMGRGSITISKYGPDTRVDLERNNDGEISKESRYISDGYVHFYAMSQSGPRPVKMIIVKDNNYPKGFAAFTDAGEFIPRMIKGGSEIIAGLVCDIYTDRADGSSFSVFGGQYVLSARFGGNVITAVSAAINAPVDSNYVKVPATLEFQDITQ